MITRNEMKQINNIMSVLKKGKTSSDNYNLTLQPFFLNDISSQNFDINFDTINNIPDGINRNVSLIYDILGSTKREVYLGDWTIMNLDKAVEIYEEYSKHGLKNVFDIGYRYMGMGHIEIISCDLDSHLLFFHPGGGSNGWDHASNFNEIVKNGPKKYNQFFFSNWFYKIKF
tara:strand:+ start:863 stop:1378 length:516 start_codon:yes stop_codon:yes gene_type:complete